MLTFPPRAGDDARSLAARLSISTTAAHVLVRRGHLDPAAAHRFLAPRLADLTSPSTMKDRGEAVSRLARAVRARERICVFGDYDADGITSAALLGDVLETLGAEVVTLLADRFDGGYGLSDAALDRVLASGATLLVTCDCGSSDHERLARARSAGLDAIVIDHHRVPEEALPALAFLNPHRPDCGFTYKGLASVGLALTICAGLRADLGVELDMRRWLDLVALGTIGDVAPLDGDNRALVRAGLAAIARGDRPGMRALAEVAGHSGGAPVTGEDIAFRFAPRINAPGRLAKPDLALRLLRSKGDAEARVLAVELDEICKQRRTIDRAVQAEALAMLEDPAMAALPVIVLAKQGWHPGVVGIVAGRLASQFGKPTIVVALEGESGRGSVRGPAGFPLYDALARARGALLGFGGHQAAAGVHVASDAVDRLRDEFAAACVALGLEANARAGEVAIDAILEPEDAPQGVLRDLAQLEPCGHTNPTPVVGFEGAKVLVAREVRGGHLKLELEHGRSVMSCFGFEMGGLASTLGARAHVAGKLRYDSFHGPGGVSLRVDAVDPA